MMGVSSKDSEEVGRLHPYARGVLMEVFMLSGEKPGGKEIQIEFLHQLVGGDRPDFDETLDLLDDMGLIYLKRPSIIRRGVILTTKGDSFVRESFVEDEDRVVYRELKAYIDLVAYKSFFRFTLARLLRRILKEHAGADVDLHRVEDELAHFLRSRSRDESNELFLHLAQKVAKSEPSPVMKRLLGSKIDLLFDLVYAATYYRKYRAVKSLYLLLFRLLSGWNMPFAVGAILGVVFALALLPVIAFVLPILFLLTLVGVLSIAGLVLLYFALTVLVWLKG